MLEVYRKVKKDRGEEKALKAYAHLENTRVVPLDSHLALAAADLSLSKKLGTVDSVIYAAAMQHGAELVTKDHHFEGLPKVSMI